MDEQNGKTRKLILIVTIVGVVVVAIGIAAALIVFKMQNDRLNNDPLYRQASEQKEYFESKQKEAEAFLEEIEQHSKEAAEKLNKESESIEAEDAWLKFCADELYKLNEKETLTASEKILWDYYLSELENAGIKIDLNK